MVTYTKMTIRAKIILFIVSAYMIHKCEVGLDLNGKTYYVVLLIHPL